MISGHQPVLNFHTGLMAKVHTVGRFGGTILWHDLDTLAEKGSDHVLVPKPRGRGLTKVSLFSPIMARDTLFTVGPVVSTGVGRLRDALLTLSDGAISKWHIDHKLDELAFSFPEGKSYGSVADFNIALWKFIMPRLGVRIPRLELLSNWIQTPDWQAATLNFLRYYSEFTDAYRMKGGQLDELPFWLWFRTEHMRAQTYRTEDLAGLAKRGLLIPKAPVLVWLIRVVRYWQTVRGIGGKEYEQPLEKAAKKLGLPIARATTVTSNQGCPDEWQELIRDQTFRPSALLLWLMDGVFDPRSIKKS